MTAFWNRAPAYIVAQWDSQLAHSIEAGAEPVFNLGVSDTVLEGLLGVTASQGLAHSSQTTITPTLLAGGGSPLWLALLWSSSFDGARNGSPKSDTSDTDGADFAGRAAPEVVYGGADMVTQIASASTLAPLFSLHFAAPAARQTGLTLPLRWLFAPGVEPGATLLWSALPFAMQPIVRAQTPAFRLESGSAPAAPATAEQTTWLAWTALFVAAALLLVAVFI